MVVPGPSVVKLVAIDLDDTLLDSGLSISHKNRQLLQEVRARGVKVTLATGRMFCSAKRYAEELEMDVPLITYQGALVRTVLSGITLYERLVPTTAACRVADFAQRRRCHYQAYFDDRLYMEKLSEEGRAYARLAGVDPVVEPDLPGLLQIKAPTKMVIIDRDTSRVKKLEEELKAELGKDLYITRSKPHYLEVLHPAATKARGLKAVADHYGIQQGEVMAIGDSYNDIEMIMWAGIGVAVGNAYPEVKEKADYVTLSNDDDGVAEALAKIVLRGG